MTARRRLQNTAGLCACLALWAVSPSGYVVEAARAMTKSAIVWGEKAAPQSYGETIHKSGLIVTGEYFEPGKIAVKQVLKGDKIWSGKTIELAAPIMMGCRMQPVPSIKTVAVLLRAGFNEIGKGNTGKSNMYEYRDNGVVEIYDLPDQIAMLRTLIPVYEKPSESERLIALRGLYTGSVKDSQTYEASPLPQFKKEFFWAINQMREPANFEIVKQLSQDKHIDAGDRLALQDWIAQTMDRRAVAVLISAINSPDRFIASSAVTNLTAYYPGAEVDEALKKFYPSASAELRPMIGGYLRGRGVQVTLPVNLQVAETAFQKAESLYGEGKLKEALSGYLSILESKESNSYIIRTAAQRAIKCIEKIGDKAAKERLIKARVDWFNHDAAVGNYLEATDTSEILRSLHDKRCLDGLLALLPRRDFLFVKPNRTAVMAILELGKDARAKAVKALLHELEPVNSAGAGAAVSVSSFNNNQDEQMRFLLEFTWLKEAQDVSILSSKIGEKSPAASAWYSAWHQMLPLIQGLKSGDEGADLIHLLHEKTALPAVALDWIYYRLGDLRDVRAIDLLVEQFKKEASYSPQTLKDALVTISGDLVARRMEAMALDKSAARQADAIDVLIEIRKEKSLPLLRQLVKLPKVDSQVRCLSGFSRFGNCDDRRLLLPMADYWKGERSVHYWVIQALAEIEARCRCKS